MRRSTILLQNWPSFPAYDVRAKSVLTFQALDSADRSHVPILERFSFQKTDWVNLQSTWVPTGLLFRPMKNSSGKKTTFSHFSTVTFEQAVGLGKCDAILLSSV